MRDGSERALAESMVVSYEIRHARLSGGNINYLKAGTGDPLILLHGINTGWGEWYPNISRLSQDFTVYALDLPGAGNSYNLNLDNADYLEDFVRPVEEFIGVEGVDKPSMVGHSFGAWISAKIASRGYVKLGSLILVSPIGFSDYIPPKFYGSSIKIIARFLSNYPLKPTEKNLKTIIEMMFGSSETRISPLFLEYYSRALIRNRSHPFIFTSFLSDFTRFSPRLDLSADLPRIKNRTAVIFGDKDPILPIDKSLGRTSLLPNSELMIYNNIGHVPSIEDAESFNIGVKKFLMS